VNGCRAWGSCERGPPLYTEMRVALQVAFYTSWIADTGVLSHLDRVASATSRIDKSIIEQVS
jgi:hypothetical protein